MKFTALFFAGIFIYALCSLTGGCSLSAMAAQLEQWRIAHQANLCSTAFSEKVEVIELSKKIFEQSFLKDGSVLLLHGSKYDVISFTLNEASALVSVTAVVDPFKDWWMNLFGDQGDN